MPSLAQVRRHGLPHRQIPPSFRGRAPHPGPDSGAFAQAAGSPPFDVGAAQWLLDERRGRRNADDDQRVERDAGLGIRVRRERGERELGSASARAGRARDRPGTHRGEHLDRAAEGLDEAAERDFRIGGRFSAVHPDSSLLRGSRRFEPQDRGLHLFGRRRARGALRRDGRDLARQRNREDGLPPLQYDRGDPPRRERVAEDAFSRRRDGRHRERGRSEGRDPERGLRLSRVEMREDDQPRDGGPLRVRLRRPRRHGLQVLVQRNFLGAAVPLLERLDVFLHQPPERLPLLRRGRRRELRSLDGFARKQRLPGAGLRDALR